jgi:threonine aldolase
MRRRDFLLSSSAAAFGALPLASISAHATARAPITPVNFRHDGLALSPAAYARLLHDITTETTLAPDNYSIGGAVAELEQRFAQRLGKPAAIYLPTGTLANQLAVRALAGTDRRVLVQADSHLYCDSGDAATVLSGLTLVPMAAGGTTISVADIEQQVERAAHGRVPSPVGVIAIENPVRRHSHRMVDLAELARVIDYARARGIRLHLDGARLFNLPQHSGVSVQALAEPFDTVYVSLWKHFNAASGAILAGEASVIDGLRHVRRMFGGALPQAWPVAVLASRFIDSYERDYAAAWDVAEALFAALPRTHFNVERLDDGTSQLWLDLRTIDAQRFVQRLSDDNISISAPSNGSSRIALQINTSLAGATAGNLIAAFERAAAG